MNKNYDVIIIGAGPAGIECARGLADTKHSVLLIEKNNIIGPKTCAGGLTNLDSSFVIPEKKTRTFNNLIVYRDNTKHIVSLAHPLKTISRIDLGKHQIKGIVRKKNITILKKEAVKEIRNNVIITSKGAYNYKYLVGADGSNSTVRKYLGLNAKACMGMYYNIPVITDSIIWCFKPRTLKSGYIWVFPHKTHTNIGVYYDPNHVSGAIAKNALEEYLLTAEYDYTNTELEAAPINYSYEGVIHNNIFLAGDAAGLASKITGEGIAFALTSGNEISKKILNPNYDMIELNRILEYKRRQEYMLKIFERMPLMQPLFFRMMIRMMKNKSFQTYIGE
ncbi:MAG: FAD-dependent monooxygenase [Candidatus Woesearchaeota archaeon]